jgi:hypothetical protein
MKNLILPMAMNTILATTLSAQAPLSMTATTNWLAASHATLGANAPAGWLMDLDAEDLEIYVTPGHALVLVDRSPIMNGDGTAYLRAGLHGLGGTNLSLVGEVDVMNASVMHGVYSGLLGGTAVIMDQYVQMRNGVPLAIMRVITRVNGSAPATAFDQEELVTTLLRSAVDPSEPALTKN